MDEGMDPTGSATSGVWPHGMALFSAPQLELEFLSVGGRELSRRQSVSATGSERTEGLIGAQGAPPQRRGTWHLPGIRRSQHGPCGRSDLAKSLGRS